MSSKEEMQTISDMLCQTYSSVAALDPPPPDASQETQEAFNNMLRTAQQASGQILSLVVGLGQSATDTNGQPLDLHLGNGQWDDLLLNNQPLSNSTDRDQDSGNEPLDAQIEQDIEELLSFANDPQAWLTLLDFRLMIEKGEHDGTTAQKEKEAFRRMLVGYKCISTDEIYDNFTSHDFKLATVSIRHHARTVRSFHTMPVTEERLFEREKLLFNPSSSTVVHAWVNTVINNIEAIEAAKDWMGEGTEWRTNFRRALAEHFYKDEFERINNSLFASTQKEKLSKKLYRRFSKKHDKIIARRKQMLRLFELFGPTILSDPTWLALTKQGYPRQSKTWYDHVRPRIIEYGHQDENIGCARYWNHRRFLLRAVGALGGQSAQDYVTDFLDRNILWPFLEEPVDSEPESD